MQTSDSNHEKVCKNAKNTKTYAKVWKNAV